MTTSTTAELLKYADLQMAAEAFIRDPDTLVLHPSGQELIDALKVGNKHSSRFTETQAKAFADPVKGWTVLDQRANTKTGFSGTLFKNNSTGELVLSMRSTEFIDDAARDNQATNNLEIRKTGFAWGQISDMQDWYQNTLARTGGPLDGKIFSLTGYSLGGHLATAFNLLNPTAASKTVTFNGAGVGQITQGSLSQALNEFNLMRAGDTVLIAAKLDDSVLAGHYNTIRTGLTSASMTYTTAQTYLDNAYVSTGGVSGKALALWNMLSDMKTIADLAVRVHSLTASATDASHPDLVSATDIAALNLDYRMAVYLSSQNSKSSAIISGAVQAFGSKAILGTPVINTALLNQFDVVADTSPSMVANSQWHYDNRNVRVTIEDQPLYRGGIVLSAADQSWDYGNVELLVNDYVNKDFGDTHSLVLLVDSLNVQNTLLQMLPANQRDSTSEALIRKVLNDASNLVKKNGDALIGSGQGKAEGDVLENVLNALADLALGPTISAQNRLKGSPDGGTWASTTDTANGTGRDKFYALLTLIQGSSLFKKAADGTLALQLAAPSADLATQARTDFGAYAALYSLSPFVFKFGTSAAEAEVKTLWGGVHTDWATTANHLSEVSDQWLHDRAALLTRKNYYNAGNASYDSSQPDAYGQLSNQFDGEDIVWVDRASSLKIQRGGITGSTKTIVFGSDANETDIVGTAYKDRIYGGAGNDTLDGKGGDDYLEGGKDSDTYLFSGQFGNDTVLDAGGAGQIMVDSVQVTGGKKVSDGVWESNDKTLVFVQVGNDLVIGRRTTAGASTVSGTIKVKNWQSGQLGIVLAGAATPTPAPVAASSFDLSTQAGINAMLIANTPQSTQDLLVQNAGYPLSPYNDGNYTSSSVFTGSGADVIEGGVIRAVSNSIYSAGAGNDYIYARVTTSVADAIARGDDPTTVAIDSSHLVLDGGTGNDQIIGGDARDVLFGGAGDEFPADAIKFIAQCQRFIKARGRFGMQSHAVGGLKCHWHSNKVMIRVAQEDIRTGLANASMTYTTAQTYLDSAYVSTGGVSGKCPRYLRQRHAAHACAKSLPARSMRLAGPKWPGRRMDSGGRVL